MRNKFFEYADVGIDPKRQSGVAFPYKQRGIGEQTNIA
jgi:hypothetical protein